MIPFKNPITIEEIFSLKDYVVNFNRNNIQAGTRYDDDLESASLLKLFEKESHFVGLYCGMEYGHIHYRLWIDELTPKVEIIAGDPSRAYQIIEGEISKLLTQAKRKDSRDRYKLKRLEEGRPVTGGPGKSCKGTYVWSGSDGDSESSRLSFERIVNKDRVTEYFAEIAPTLDFYAVTYPSIFTLINTTGSGIKDFL